MSLFVGAAFGALGLLANVPLAAFFLAILADRLGMIFGPIPWQQRLVIGFAGKEPCEHVIHVGPDIQIAAVSTADQAHESGTALTACQASAEQPVLASHGGLFR